MYREYTQISKRKPSPLTLSYGQKYEGDFKDGQITGTGILNYKDGSRYEGQFFEGKKHGWGKLYLNDDQTYIGEFADVYIYISLFCIYIKLQYYNNIYICTFRI